MKFALKALVSALALAAAGQASAFTASATNNDLILNVWDSTLGESYSRDLGITFSQFLANDATPQLFSQTSGLFASIFGTDTNISWNIVGSGVNGGKAESIVGVSGSVTATTGGSNGLLTDEQVFIGYLNSAATTNNGVEATSNSTASNAFGGTYWKSSYNGTVTGTSGTGFGSLNAFSIQSGSSNFSAAKVTALPQGTFTLLADGSVQYGAAPSQVPVPAALWLMGSGLVGLFGIGRRRQAA